MNLKPTLGRSIAAGAALLTAVAASPGIARAETALIKEGAAITEKLVQQQPKCDELILKHLGQKAQFKQQKENAGWIDKLILQPLQGAWDKVTSNRCFNETVDKILDKSPVTEATLKEGAEAIKFNQACKDVGTDIVATLAAGGAGAATGGLGAVPAWGLASGAATKVLVKSTSTNNEAYTVGKGAYDATTGALAGYGGAKITYKAPITKGNGGGIDGGGGGGGPLD